MLGRALLETGTARSSLADLTRRIDRDTGGIGHGLELQSGVGDGPGGARRGGVARFVLRGKSLAARADALGDLMLEVLTEARVDDRDAVRRLALEDLARRRTALEPAGTQFALRRLAAHGGPEARLGEILSGIASLATLATFVRRVDEDWDALRAELLDLRARLFARSRLVAGVTADDETAAAARPAIAALLDGLPSGEEAGGLPDLDAPDPAEGWALPGQVHYSGVRWLLRDGGRLPGSWLAATRHLSADVLIPLVRFQGGAYGAGAALDPLAGSLMAQAYRDPNLAETLATFRSLPQALREAADALDEAALDTLIVGAVGKLDPYALPGSTGYRALLRYLRGTEGEVDRLRSELLATQRQDFRDLADAIEAAGEPTSVVLGPRDNLEAVGEPAGWVVREPV